MIDLIRDGVPPTELRATGARAVWSALVRTAASAQQRGQPQAEWEALLAEARSHLGTQVRLRNGKDGKERPARAHARTLANAWVAAGKWLAEQPPPYDREAARDRARTVRDWTADAETPLPDAERAILAHAAEVALHHGTDRPALPRTPMQEATGLGLTALRSALDRLHRGGLLVLEVRGHPGGPATRTRRANCYRLPTDEAMHSYLYRETRSVVPPGQVCGASSLLTHGAPAQVCGAPDEKGPLMVTLTLSAASPEALADAWAALHASRDVQVTEQPAPAAEGNVVPIRRPARERRPA